MVSEDRTPGRPRRAFLETALAVGAATGGCLQPRSEEQTGGTPGTGANTANRTVRLGVVLPLSGAFSEMAVGMRRAAELAARQLERSEDEGLTVDVAVRDSQLDPEVAVQAVRDLASEGYPAVVGPATSPATIEAATRAFAPEGVVGCSPSATSPAISDLADGDFVFRTAPSVAFRGRATAIAVHDTMGADRAAVLHSTERGIVDAFQETYERLGGSITSTTTYTEGRDSYTGLLEEVLQDDLDVLVLSGVLGDYVTLLDDLRTELGSGIAVVVTGDGRNLASESSFGIGTVRGIQRVPSGESSAMFRESYREEYGTEPGAFGPEAYDAAAVLLLANAAAGVNEGAAVRGTLREVANPEGSDVTVEEGMALAQKGRAIVIEDDKSADITTGEETPTGGPIQLQGASGPLDFDDNGDVTTYTYALVGYGDGGPERITTITVEG